MADLVIEKINEVYLKVKTEPSIEYELRDRFTFEVPNKKFMPQYRSRYWDGYVHLFNMKTKRIYVGLLDKIVAFCENSGYSYEFEKNKFYGAPFEVNEMISWEGVKDYVTSITKFKLIFENLFPISLTTLEFDATQTDLEYFTAEVTFKYTIYNIRDI